MKRALIGVLCGVSALALWGCASSPVEYARDYPVEKPRVGSADIQVLRDETKITLTNTTAESYGPFTLWLNRWFSRPVDGLAVGETITLSLKDFRDVTSEGFRAGGFFATKQPYPIVSADIETETEVIGLVVIAERR